VGRTNSVRAPQARDPRRPCDGCGHVARGDRRRRLRFELVRAGGRQGSELAGQQPLRPGRARRRRRWSSWTRRVLRSRSRRHTSPPRDRGTERGHEHDEHDGHDDETRVGARRGRSGGSGTSPDPVVGAAIRAAHDLSRVLERQRSRALAAELSAHGLDSTRAARPARENLKTSHSRQATAKPLPRRMAAGTARTTKIGDEPFSPRVALTGKGNPDGSPIQPSPPP
jgi:hypothetical protein